MSRLRERGRDGCLAGLQVQQLFCSHNTNIPEHQLKELNMKIDSALQVNIWTVNQPAPLPRISFNFIIGSAALLAWTSNRIRVVIDAWIFMYYTNELFCMKPYQRDGTRKSFWTVSFESW